MCGIIGYTGPERASPILLGGLKRLEYRGYDSAGVAVAGDGHLDVVRTVGRVAGLVVDGLTGTTGIGHVRWATHGAPTEANAHPHVSCDGRFAVVHNGIIDNHAELRGELTDAGHKFLSDTDTEVFVHLVEAAWEDAEPIEGSRLLGAALSAAAHLAGAYAFVVTSTLEPGTLVALRNKSPLIVGLGEDANFVASDVPAILEHTKRVLYLGDEEAALVRPDGWRVTDLEGGALSPEVHEVTWTLEDAEKGGYDHFMLKEIHECPRAIHEVLRGRLGDAERRFDVEGRLADRGLRDVERVVVVACGTSYHAGLFGKTVLERLANLPVDVVHASEFRYGSGFADHRTLAVGISQSGETADTLEAIRRAKLLEHRTLAITNVVGSTLTREADGVFYLRAGPEIGVAATKSFVNTAVAFYLLGLHLAAQRNTVTPAERGKLAASLKNLPRAVQRVLDDAARYEEVGRSVLAPRDHCFFIGRQLAHGVALEGALKLKEISYAHAEGYPAGELKHGPLALLEPGFPVVALTPRDETHQVVLSNVGECRARDAVVVAIAADGDHAVTKVASHVLRVPDVDPLFYPVPAVVGTYLLAYYAARERGCDIDKPRNLAKSVTVE